ncbi:MAG: CSLREA domain-containing protein [Acidimicrobiia bacterium]
MHVHHRTWVAVAVALGASLAGSTAVAAADPNTGPPQASARTISVTSTDDRADAKPGDGSCADVGGACTLRAAIQEANARAGTTNIEVPHGTYRLAIANVDGDEDAAATGDLDVTSSIRLRGFGATVDAAGLDRAFEVLPGASLHAWGLTITGGLVSGGADPVSGSGGGIANAGELVLDAVTLTANAATGPAASGGAILNTGSLHLQHSTVAANTATRAGGGIEANGGSTTVHLSTLRDNGTGPGPGNGGALHLTGAGAVHVVGSLIEGNTATAEGGGLWNSAPGTMAVRDTVVTANRAGGDAADEGGGGLFNDGGTLEVSRSVISRNVADGAAGSGGGILNDGGLLRVDSSGLLVNEATRAGGGIEADAGRMELRQVWIDGNRTGPAPGNGGGVHITGAGDATIDGAVVTGNVAASEGGGLWNGSGTMTVRGATITGNRASGDAADNGGGGLFNNGGTLEVRASTIADNVADGVAGSGGGVLNDQGTTVVDGSLLIGNTATRAGGGIEANVGVTTITATKLSGNETGANPGNGGAVHLTGAGSVDIDRSSVMGNRAAAEGGGLWNSATGTMTVTATELAGGRAPSGPDVFNDGGTLRIDGPAVMATAG